MTSHSSNQPDDDSCIIKTPHGDIDLHNPKPEDIRIEVIARALSREHRWLGLTEQPWTVGQHSLMCVKIAQDHLFQVDTLLACLLHDASEAFLHDMPPQLKKLMPGYRALEHKLSRAIASAFRLQYPWPWAVKLVDRQALQIERAVLYERQPGTRAPEIMAPRAMEDVEAEFLEKFHELTTSRARRGEARRAVANGWEG
jgi:hypothetical protein